MKTAKRILYDAQLKIKKGWCKGSFYRDKKGEFCTLKQADSYCIVGALWAARKLEAGSNISTSDSLINARDAVNKAFLLVKSSAVCLSDFNDNPTTTKKDILDLLKKAKEFC